ncbi:MAG: hypothetical protein E7544_00840 [Ruminococcaceae bacterium]|nr:hypothetical protein [Oscillospiraceae bacterium]
MKSKFFAFFTVTLVLCGAVFGIYWKFVRMSQYPVFIESFDHGVLTVDSTQTTGSDNKYRVWWERDETITININPERTADSYYNLKKLTVNGVDVTKQVSMLQYRTPVTEKLTILAFFEKGTPPESFIEEEKANKVTATAPAITKAFDNKYVGAYAAYDIEDPSVFHDEATGYYYCFGSDNVVVKSKDLVNWSGRTTYFNTPEGATTNAIMDFTQFESVRKWASEHGYSSAYNTSDSKSDRTPLAPDIVKIGTVYYLYFSLSKQTGANESAIFVVKTTNLEASITQKKWIDGGMVICSCGNHGGTQKTTDANGVTVDTNVNTHYDPANAVHPSVMFDGTNLYMVYGGYYGSRDINGGIYLLQLDTGTGLLKAGSAINTAGEKIGTLHGSDAKPAGTLLAKPGRPTSLSAASSSLISAADLIHNKATGYYYLFTTYGVSDTNYNIRVARSSSITGPYTDFAGNLMNDATGNQYDKGYMLMGGYNFTSSSAGCVSYTDVGRASIGSPKIIKASNGTYLIASQSQLYYKVGSEILTGSVIAEREEIVMKTEPSLEIRELVWDNTGWPLALAEMFSGKLATKGVETEDMLGIWDLLVFDSSCDRKDYKAVARNASQRISIFSNAVITSTDIEKNTELNTTGLLRKESDYFKLTIDGVEYKLHPRYMWDWELGEGSLILTGIGADGSTVWAKKNFSSTTGVYTDAFYYLYNKCDDATKLTIDAKVKKISANPTQNHVDTLSRSIIKHLITQASTQKTSPAA